MKAVLEVFYRPARVFESLAGRSWAWVVPMILDMLLIVVMTWEYPHYIGPENLVRKSIQMSGRNMTPEQIQTAVTQATSPVRIYTGYAFLALEEVLILLAISGALMPFGRMTGRAPPFGTMFSMVSLAHFPYFLALIALTTLVLALSPDPASMDWQNLVPTNVAAFMNRNETSKGLYNVMESIDVLSIPGIALLALGFSKITHVKFRFGLAAVLALWAFYVLIKMALAVAFGIEWV